MGTLTISNNNEDLAVAFKFEKKALNTKVYFKSLEDNPSAGGNCSHFAVFSLQVFSVSGVWQNCGWWEYARRKYVLYQGYILRNMATDHNGNEVRYQLSKDDKKIRVEDGFIIRSVLIPHNRHNLKLYDIVRMPCFLEFQPHSEPWHLMVLSGRVPR